MDEYDAIVVGSGINGLVAAAELATVGWSVAIVERNDEVGGFIASGERTLPGFVHDTYSSIHTLFTSGAAYEKLGAKLHEHGLRYINTDGAVTGSVAPGSAVVAYRDPARTAEGFSVPSDRGAYLAMLEEMGRRAPAVFGALGSELRSVQGAKLLVHALRSQRMKGLGALAHDAMMSGRSFLRSRFTGTEIDQLWGPWLLHAGLSPDHAGGGLMIPVFAAANHQFGAPQVAGGAGNFVAAFKSLLSELGVVTMTGRLAERITVSGRRATGVVTDAGTLRARRAVLASVTPQALYGSLLKDAPIPPLVREEAERFRYGRAVVQLHVALDRPLQWADERLQDVPVVHISTGTGSTGIACAQADAGMLPAAPTMMVGRQHLLDPDRVPEGKGLLWMTTQEAPWRPREDAAGTIPVDGTWSKATTDAFVERMLDRVEQCAPGTVASVLKTDVLNPTDMVAINPNAVNGDVYSGSMEMDQSMFWRPLPHQGKHATAIRGLWHIGASTHPGPGLAGGSGHLAAQQLLSQRRR
ncbi:NAD(P)/FAD-dependent oxidoreductase [Nocardioides hungaricus]